MITLRHVVARPSPGTLEPVDESLTGEPDDFSPVSAGVEPDSLPFGLTVGRLAVLVAALLFLAGVVGYRIGRPDPPGRRSADVGFLQDMIRHHQQAVEMAFSTADTATDPVVRSFAKELIVAQGREIGIMEAWLGRWGYPRDHDGPKAMEWTGMSHPKDAMPGLATPAQLDALYSATGRAVDEQFLRLMIAHHAGGVTMAEALLRRGADREVRDLARRIIKTQRSEISEMQFALRRLGFPAADLPVDGMPMTGTTSPATGTTHHSG